jgi:hypothetical protein
MIMNRRTPGRRALTSLHASLLVLCAFAVAVLGVVVFPEGRSFLEQHFGVVRALSYVAWGAGFAGFALAPVLLLRELGIVRRITLRPKRLRAAFDMAGMPSVGRAFALGAVGNGLVLLLSPLGLALGEYYSWPVFCAHLIVSALLVAASSFGALVRIRDFVSELQPLPVPQRASHASPAGSI